MQSAAASASLPAPSFSFIHVLQLVQPVSPSSPYRLPALSPGQILPSRLATTSAPFPVTKPTNLDALYRQANEGRDPEEARRERNRKKKERKLRSVERRAGISDGPEGVEDGDASAAASAEPAGLVYGLPSDIPSEVWLLFEVHYHRHHHAASLQREQAWQLMQGQEEKQWGNIILHDSSSTRGKRDNSKGGFSRNAADATVDFHWVV
ncbi:hypothetical protein JCM8097_000542 [Rhodosporidiobolus ruineniae]